MTEGEGDRRIVLTDPPPVPTTKAPCWRCGAPASQRRDVSGFGKLPVVVCGACGALARE